jgi:cob(I)alamin adenosyltransferase
MSDTAQQQQQQRRIKIYTKTGDKGTSSLYTGERRNKDDIVFDALGTVDELNSFVGLARSVVVADRHQSIADQLILIQSSLLDLGACVATPRQADAEVSLAKRIARTEFGDHPTAELEAWIDAFDAQLPPLRNFVLPSGGALSAHLHVCRSVTRRAERIIVCLARDGHLEDSVPRYVNRLSDYFFVAARFACQTDGETETIYKPGRSNKKQPDELQQQEQQ